MIIYGVAHVAFGSYTSWFTQDTDWSTSCALVNVCLFDKVPFDNARM